MQARAAPGPAAPRGGGRRRPRRSSDSDAGSGRPIAKPQPGLLHRTVIIEGLEVVSLETDGFR
jgi:hypothetical protein